MSDEKVQQSQLMDFLALAEIFCNAVDCKLSRKAWSQGVLEGLAAVYIAAIRLPKFSPTTNQLVLSSYPQSERDRVIKAVSSIAGTDGVYWIVLEEEQERNPVQIPVTDDIADIYCILREAIQARNAGSSLPDIGCEVKADFETHWGEHATNAMKVLHQMVFASA